MNNPIIDNRIVSDYTFALRFRNFIRKVQVCDQCGEEEQEYLLMVANNLLKYQVETVTPNSDEAKYIDNVKDLIYDYKRKSDTKAKERNS
jgi:hypothetical protein